MSLTRDDVLKVSLLARLDLTPAEVDAMTGQLGQIVEYVELLNELETEEVEPMAHAVPTFNVFRDDVVRESLSREAMLSNAPKADGECYLVPAVLGE